MEIKSPMTQSEWEQIVPRLSALGLNIIAVGIMDDMAPDGSPNTACQLSYEQAVTKGQIIMVTNTVRPGITLTRQYMLVK